MKNIILGQSIISLSFLIEDACGWSYPIQQQQHVAYRGRSLQAELINEESLATASSSSSSLSLEISIRVEGSLTHSLLPSGLATHGRLFSNQRNRPLQFLAPNEDVSFNVVAATNTETGEPVLAFVGSNEAKSFSKSSLMKVPTSSILSRPSSLSLEEAMTLPYYAVGLLPQLMKAGIHDGPDAESAAAKTCVVTGTTPHAIIATQILKAWGCEVIGCSRRNHDTLVKAGASHVIDFSKESFSEKIPNLAVVVDTLGIDGDSLASNLMQYKGASYVSTMPSAIRRMQQKGLLQGASIFGSVFGGKLDVAPTNAYWIPEKQGMEVISYVLKLGEAKGVVMPTKGPGLEDYMDAILWPKDAETQARFGFPSPPPAEEDLVERGRSGLLDEATLLREYRRRKRNGGDAIK